MLVSDTYTDAEFRDLLSSAAANASRGRDMEFVEEMESKFEQWGSRCFLSEAQENWLKRLAREG